MKRNLFLTTALVAVSFVAKSALAEEVITERLVVASGETRSFNQATADGIESPDPYISGGVIKNEGTVNIDDSTFTDNSAERGGVIYNSNILNIGNSSFENNHASISAGAIYNSSHGVVNISGNTTFEGNTHAPNAGEEIPNDIFNVGTLNLNPGADKTISFKGGIDGDGGNDHGTMNVNGQGTVHVENELIYHDVNLNSGTLELDSYTSAKASRFVINEQAKFSADRTEFKNSNVKEENKDGGAIFRTFTDDDDAGDEMINISNSEFKNNTARNGGAIANKSTAGSGTGDIPEYIPNVIKNSDFMGNESEYSGGAIYNEGVMYIENSDFIGNQTGDSQAYGGAIYNSSDGFLTLKDSNFRNNTAGSSGGAIYNSGTVAIGGNSTFRGNKHTSNEIANDIYNIGTLSLNPGEDETISFEGGIDGEGGEGEIVIWGDGKVSISNELAYQDVKNLKGTLELTPNTNVKNSYIDVTTVFEGDTILNAKGVSFNSRDASSGEYGGVIYSNSEINIKDSEFVNNTISSSEDSYGGAILNDGNANISNTLFSGNKIITIEDLNNVDPDNEDPDNENTENEDTIKNKGGAIANYDQMIITKSEFSDNEIVANESDNYGGAISNKQALITIEDSEFNNNKVSGNDSDNYGGAINNEDGYVSIINSFFVGNKVTGNNSNNSGGAINNTEDSYVAISNTTFTNNEAGDAGGAINNKESEITISDATFISNKTADSAGAINNEGGTITISNSTFTNNKVMHSEGDYMLKYGGAINNTEYSSMEISGTAFNNNKVKAAGSALGGAISNDKSLLTITNTTFTGNEATGGAASSGGAIYNSGAIDEEGESLSIINIADSTFSKNISSWGGAIDNSGKLGLTNVSFVENKAEYYSPENGGVGGAIRNYSEATVTGSNFSKNTSFLGGAIYNDGDMTLSNSSFSDNKATIEDESSEIAQGGAIYNIGKLTVSATDFTGNETKGNFVTYGGAISNEGSSSEITISDSTFEGNKATSNGWSEGRGGAISNEKGTLTVSNTSFVGNKTYGTNGSPDTGGAIYNYEGTATISGATFTGNETIGSASGSGGAIYNSGTLIKEGIMSITNSTFTDNKSSFGGAISNSNKLTITNSTFDGNLAHNYYASGEDYGGRGGALINFYGGNVEITDSTFTNNTALRLGGAMENGGNITFSGHNVFEGNKAGDQLNDIYNTRNITVSGDLTLDGGITGYSAMSPGKITFTDGSNLTVKAGTTSIVNNDVKNEGATLHMNFDNGYTGQYALIADGSTLDNEFTLADNNLYNISVTDINGTYDISKKSNSEIADKIGASSNDVAAILAITSGDSANPSFNKIADNISDLIQSNNAEDVKAAIEATHALAPDADPIIEQSQTATIKQVFNAVGTRLSGGISGGSQGMSSGDALEDLSVWVQGLANRAKLDTTSKSNGFRADTYGVAFGLEKKLDNDVKAGVGYAYNTTDVDAKGRDTEIKTHTLLAYGEYKPSDWFVNGVISYSWSDYKEKKNVFGNIVDANYDVETLGLQAMTGYDLHTQFATITPEAGLRYVRINGDNYVDSAGQSIASGNSNIITGVIGSKISKAIETESGLRLTPEARLALTYDLKQAHNKSNVVLPNGSSYSINGKTLDRFGVEVGGSLTAEVEDNVEMSLGYEGGFRDDYQDHSGLLNVKYKF